MVCVTLWSINGLAKRN